MPHKLYSLFLFLLLAQFCGAQNLVPNPSFEDTVSCPTGGGQVWKAEHWYVAEKTPDYFNECCTNQAFAVPNSSVFGNRYAATGFAFSGFYGYSTVDTFYREKIGVQLSNDLSIGTKYFVSFKLTTTTWDAFSGASNKVGVLFSTQKYTPAHPSLTKDYCQMWVDSIITDTVNWVQVTGSFIADSAYSFITIGNFFTNAHTDTIRFWEPPTNTSYYLQSYYFIDDVCVSTDSTFCATWTNIQAQVADGDVIKAYPNPAGVKLTVDNIPYDCHEIQIFNVEGKLMQSISVYRNTKLAIDISLLPLGIYSLIIKTEKSIQAKRFVKANY